MKINTKLTRDDYLTNLESKTPSNKKGTQKYNNFIKNNSTFNNTISQKRGILKNKLIEERNTSPQFYNKNEDKNEQNYENKEENDILAPYLSNIKIKENLADEEGSIQMKSTKNLNKINRKKLRSKCARI